MIAKALHIRKRARLSERVPIVIFSVDILDESAELESPERVYLTHPDNFDQLRLFLRRILEACDSAK